MAAAKKKKAARRPARQPIVVGDGPPAGEDPVMQSTLAKMQAKFGKAGVFLGRDADARIRGIPYPALCWEWLTGINVLPEGKMLGIAGPPQSQKSSLLFEVMNWAAKLGGRGWLLEAEGEKYSPVLVRSLIGQVSGKQRFAAFRCPTIDVVQKAWLALVKDIGAKPGGATVIGVDSLTGSDTAEGMKKLDKTGSSNRKPPEAARSWSEFFKDAVAKTVGLPVYFVIVNHLKDQYVQSGGPRTFGPKEKRPPGGEAQMYHSATYLWLQRSAKSVNKCKGLEFWENGRFVRRYHEWRTVEIRNKKSSYGADGRKFSVDMVWWHGADGEQVTVWDWDAATARLLLRLQDPEEYIGCDPDLVAEVCDVEYESGLYFSKRLGVRKHGVPDTEIGRLIRTDEVLTRELRDLLHIKSYAEIPSATGEEAAAAEEEPEDPTAEEQEQPCEAEEPEPEVVSETT